jgi:hypothetical protein
LIQRLWPASYFEWRAPRSSDTGEVHFASQATPISRSASARGMAAVGQVQPYGEILETSAPRADVFLSRQVGWEVPRNCHALFPKICGYPRLAHQHLAPAGSEIRLSIVFWRALPSGFRCRVQGCGPFQARRTEKARGDGQRVQLGTFRFAAGLLRTLR